MRLKKNANKVIYYYGCHCILGGDQWDEYKTEINETGLKVKELAEWALNKFNTKTRAAVWFEARPLQVHLVHWGD